MGASPARIVMRHVMPLCISSLIVRVTLDMAGIIITAAGLGFLGLGAQPPLPEWGAMIASGRRFILDQWWVATMPGMAILIVSLGFNLLGDGLRDALDPRAATDERTADREGSAGALSDPHRRGRGGARHLVHARPRTAWALSAKAAPANRRPAAPSWAYTDPRAEVTASKLEFDGIDLLTAPPKLRRDLRGRRIAMILQDPKYSLDPVMTIGRQIVETLRARTRMSPGRGARERALDMLAAVQIRDPAPGLRPLSARGVGRHGAARHDRHDAGRRTQLLIADEPTSALDVTVQLDVLAILDRLVADRGMGLIFISHDLQAGLVLLRPCHRDVCGQDRRGAACGRALPTRAASLHAGACSTACRRSAPTAIRCPFSTARPEWAE